MAVPYFGNNDDSSGLEQQDTIVRQVSYETANSLGENTTIGGADSTNAMFSNAVAHALDYFSKKQLPEIKKSSVIYTQQAQKGVDDIQKKIL